jgi:hypothetical protein
MDDRSSQRPFARRLLLMQGEDMDIGVQGKATDERQ